MREPCWCEQQTYSRPMASPKYMRPASTRGLADDEPRRQLFDTRNSGSDEWQSVPAMRRGGLIRTTSAASLRLPPLATSQSLPCIRPPRQKSEGWRNDESPVRPRALRVETRGEDAAFRAFSRLSGGSSSASVRQSNLARFAHNPWQPTSPARRAIEPRAPDLRNPLLPQPPPPSKWKITCDASHLDRQVKELSLHLPELSRELAMKEPETPLDIHALRKQVKAQTVVPLAVAHHWRAARDAVPNIVHNARIADVASGASFAAFWKESTAGRPSKSTLSSVPEKVVRAKVDTGSRRASQESITTSVSTHDILESRLKAPTSWEQLEEKRDRDRETRRKSQDSVLGSSEGGPEQASAAPAVPVTPDFQSMWTVSHDKPGPAALHVS